MKWKLKMDNYKMLKLKYLIVYPSYSHERDLQTKALALRISSLGFNVETFGIPCPGGWWSFQRLNESWKSKSTELMDAYAKLLIKCDEVDVIISDGGSMLHPEFLDILNVFKVFICADDPESSEILSKPVANAFDICLIANIACIEMYKEWGCKNVQWLYLPVSQQFLNINLTEIDFKSKNNDIILCSERVYGVSDRGFRIEKLIEYFPQAEIYGKGWSKGYIGNRELINKYRKSKIGWNLHNSVGPVNSRLMTLPAFGVLQICDCKGNLGKIFELGKEVVGFDTLNECKELTEYYLNNEAEREEIAIKGMIRVRKDYTEKNWWYKIIEYIARHQELN